MATRPSPKLLGGLSNNGHLLVVQHAVHCDDAGDEVLAVPGDDVTPALEGLFSSAVMFSICVLPFPKYIFYCSMMLVLNSVPPSSTRVFL